MQVQCGIGYPKGRSVYYRFGGESRELGGLVFARTVILSVAAFQA
jgi:hypothetical protein